MADIDHAVAEALRQYELKEFTPEERRIGEAQARNPGRWHARNGADWLAIRLQCGRGRMQTEVAAEFGVTQPSIRDRARRQRWLPRPLSKGDRLRLSRLVFVGGWFRARYLGLIPDTAMLARISAHSAVLPDPLLWSPTDMDGDLELARTLQSYGETHGDPDRAGDGGDWRERAFAELDRILARAGGDASGADRDLEAIVGEGMEDPSRLGPCEAERLRTHLQRMGGLGE